LCTGQTLNSHYPIKLDIEKINKISLGGQHTAILTENKELYMCGNGIHGELGRGNKLESSTNYRSKPVLVDYFKENKREVIDVSCGRNHTIVLTNIYI